MKKKDNCCWKLDSKEVKNLSFVFCIFCLCITCVYQWNIYDLQKKSINEKIVGGLKLVIQQYGRHQPNSPTIPSASPSFFYQCSNGEYKQLAMRIIIKVCAMGWSTNHSQKILSLDHV